jgi:dipeptidyl-peptidase-4
VLEQHVYSLSLDQPQQIERLSEPGFTHAAEMDEQGQALMVSRSSSDQPPQSYLADASGSRLAWIEENRLDASHPYAPYLASHRATSFGELKAADGTQLHWMMITPEMEPGKRYPVFFQHYGGPHAQQVTNRWLGAQPQAIVDRGFIYFELDNRGSANRGVAFEQSLYRAMGSVEVEDQKAGARYLQTLPFVDGNKIATYGWSYGGYMTLKMLEADPGLYAAGIAGAPVTRWELYDTHYTERYMGVPQSDGQAYVTANAMEDSGAIDDPLLLIHGMADDNVVFENSTALAAKLQAAAVPFEMMFYPGQTHRPAGEQVNAHVWETIFAFLLRNGVDAPE